MRSRIGARRLVTVVETESHLTEEERHRLREHVLGMLAAGHRVVVVEGARVHEMEVEL